MPNLALPHHQHVPPHVLQSRCDCGIAHAIRLEFSAPILHSSAWEARAGTPRVAVPVATVHENHLPARTKDDVRASRKIARVQAITVPIAVEKAPNSQLWTGILGADSRHQGASLRRRQPIGVHGLDGCASRPDAGAAPSA